MKKKQKCITNFILVFILCVLSAVPVLAAPKDDWKTVRVSIGINKALYFNDTGEVEGYCKEYITALAEINHWNLEYVEDSWSDSIQNLMNGKIDLLFPTQMTEERQKTMGFSASSGGYQPIGLYAKADSNYLFDDYASFDGARIAVSAGSSNEMVLQEYATENGFSYMPVYMNTTEEKMEALQNGTVDLLVFSTLNDVENGKVVSMLDYLPFYYCTRIDDTELLEELNYGMKQMIIRNPDLVQNVSYSFMNKGITFALSKEEYDAVHEKEKVIVGVYKDTEPLFSINENGEYEGIYWDILQRIEKISGLELEVRALNRNEYVYDYLNRGEIDFILGSSDQALKYSDAVGYVQSEGVMDYYTIAISKANDSLDGNDNPVYALTGGRRYWEPQILSEQPNATFMYLLSSKDCLNAVQSGKANVTLLNTWEYNYQSKNKKYENLIEWDNSRILSQTVFVSLDSENEQIRSVINKAIEQISNAEKEAFITANLNRPYSSYDFSDRLYEMKDSIILFGSFFIILVAGLIIYLIMKRKSTKKLRIANEELFFANEAKDRFLSRMSHELRTPLNAISGFAEIIVEEAQENRLEKDKLMHSAQSIIRASHYQLAIVMDLLDMQKIQTGKMEIKPTEISPKEYMQDIIEMMELMAKEKNICFTYHSLSDVTNQCRLDGIRLKQVLLNILSNAVKFTPVGGKVSMTSQVTHVDENNSMLKFVITDSGIGMSEEFQEKYLFKRFAQEDQTNSSPYDGCGTGLSIAKEIIHLMGGEITCSSKENEGSTFTVVVVAHHAKMKKRREHKTVENYDLKGIKILLCEDNPMNQDIEKRVLEKMHCEVDIAGDGKIGVELYSASQPNDYAIVLMDIRMPNMDGLEATREIRALEREDAKNVPILAVSANAFEEDIQASLAAGMNEHLAKPVDAKILYSKIKEYCILS